MPTILSAGRPLSVDLGVVVGTKNLETDERATTTPRSTRRDAEGEEKRSGVGRSGALRRTA
jgi:hypothetical protein